MKYLLTNDLWKKIYEYDNTYHIINKLLIEELYLKTSFWKLKWINRKMDYVSRTDRISFRETTKKIFYYDYQSSANDITKLANYWNFEFSPTYPSQKNNNRIGKNCENEFLTDHNSNCYKHIFQNIKMLKEYKPKKTKYKYILYKPKK